MSRFSDVKRATPWYVAMPDVRKPSSTCAGTGSVNVRLKRMSAVQSMRGSGATTLALIRRCQSISSDAPTNPFLGSQPRRAQVPPYGWSSMTATRHPALRQRVAGPDPPCPVPMTMRSYDSVMKPAIRVEHLIASQSPDPLESQARLAEHGAHGLN